MKTKVEVLGYEIEIEEVDGVVTVKAELDGDVVEEFTLETPDEDGAQSQSDDDDVKGFGDFDEEDDFGQSQGQSQGQGQSQSQGQSQGQDEEEEVKLESFKSFFNKK